MNLLSGDIVPVTGESRRSHKLRIGRYAQVRGLPELPGLYRARALLADSPWQLLHLVTTVSLTLRCAAAPPRNHCPQHFVDALSFDENPVEYLMNRFPTAGLKPEGMRAMLGRFGLSGQHHLTPICKLSGECAAARAACCWGATG